MAKQPSPGPAPEAPEAEIEDPETLDDSDVGDAPVARYFDVDYVPIGCLVLVCIAERGVAKLYGGASASHPAIVSASLGQGVVNLRVLLDGPEVPWLRHIEHQSRADPLNLTTTWRFPDEAMSEQWAAALA